MSQTHIRAVNRTIKALGLDADDRYNAIVEVSRTLARQMDTAGTEPSTRLVAAYLSALKDINRARPLQAAPGTAREPDDLDAYLSQCGLDD
ncbi:hypothetical protein [Bifidobacterium callitrichidarum]|uniref:Uncharacterized protein n=1 Tax=Bifidobacterium callitrichidarum TaxID=2052941 RepID=A0A2U2N3U4_9BIFI|nr:hypothetical protein [Bifidobacterium callitrichidarum]PWG63846.1 hypothetical protein DF196_10030 [Bifidobacterium callitrichidarum]